MLTRTHTDTDKAARKKVKQLADACGTRAAAAKHLGVNKGLVSYVLAGGHSPTVLRALDMPVLEQVRVEVCIDCGQLHKLAKSCKAGNKPAKPRYRQIAEMRSREEMEALDDLAKYNGFNNWSTMCRWLACEAMLGNEVWVE